MAAGTDRPPGPTVLHAWGAAATGPEGDAALIDGAGAAPDVVVTPSYWGGRRRELFAGELVRRGFDPRIGDLATELMGLERPSVGHSFLVEVEAARICVSRLDFGAGLADSRLSFRGGDALEIILDVAGGLLGAGAGPGQVLDTGDVEFIVAAADDRLLADMRRRGWLAFPVPVGLLGTAGLCDGARGRAGRREAEDGPAEPVADGGAVTPVGETGGLDVAALRRRARELDDGRRRPGRGRSVPVPVAVPAVPAVAAGVVACAAVVAAVAAIGLIVEGPVGGVWREEAVVAAAADEPGDVGADAGPARIPGSGNGTGAPDANAGEAPPLIGLEGEGVRVELPEGWRIDERAAADALVLVDGGPMRILVTAGEVPAAMDADGLAAGLTAHAAGDPAMDRVRREAVEGIDVVVLEERPPDGSVVLWHHRIVDGWQVSVGCQFRGATIPQVRPVCGQALRSSGVVGP